MSYKLVAMDCDGTLLNSTGHIPQQNIDTVNKLQQKGIKFVVATGRNDLLAKDYIEEMGISAPIIGCNGASVRDIFTNQTIHLDTIPKEIAKSIFDFCTVNNLPFKALTLSHCYTNNIEMHQQGIFMIVSQYTKKLKTTMPNILIENMYPLLDTENFLKIVLVNNDMKFLMNTQQKLRQLQGINAVRSAKNCIDIISATASKGNALKTYAQTLSISQAETIAIGDSENDISMLDFAGLSIAMDNADEQVKSHADIIAPVNDNAGVSQVLANIFSDIL